MRVEKREITLEFSQLSYPSQTRIRVALELIRVGWILPVRRAKNLIKSYQNFKLMRVTHMHVYIKYLPCCFRAVMQAIWVGLPSRLGRRFRREYGDLNIHVYGKPPTVNVKLEIDFEHKFHTISTTK
jgi:hypothetical protein